MLNSYPLIFCHKLRDLNYSNLQKLTAGFSCPYPCFSGGFLSNNIFNFACIRKCILYPCERKIYLLFGSRRDEKVPGATNTRSGRIVQPFTPPKTL